MLYKLATIVTILGCVILLVLIFLNTRTGYSTPFLKPLLWVTICALLVRIVIRIKRKS